MYNKSSMNFSRAFPYSYKYRPLIFTNQFLFIVNFFAEPLSFLVKPDVILHGYQAHSLTLNCSTNDRNATVSLYHRHHPLAPFRERNIDAKKVLLKGQVFTLLNLSLKDQGTYACEAKIYLAILRITNAQMEDSGVYQCVLRVFEKTSMKSVEITVSHN